MHTSLGAKRAAPQWWSRRWVWAVLLVLGVTLLYVYYEQTRLFRAYVPPGFTQRLAIKDLPHCKDDPRAQYNMLIKLFIEPLNMAAELARHSVRHIVYLPSLIELTHPRKFYIDAGGRAFESSTGGWFLPIYTATNPRARDFHIIAFEPDPLYRHEWEGRANIEFYPYAVSDRNGTANFGSKWLTIVDRTGVPTARAPGQEEHNVTTIDFSDLLKRRVNKDDFLVVKMDVEGAEWLVVPKMIEEGTIYLIDELFLECHAGYREKKRADCLDLIVTLRNMGIYAHEWQ